MPPPRKTYLNHRVRLRTTLRNRAGEVFRSGEVLWCVGMKKGLLDLIDRTSITGNSAARGINGVWHSQVEVQED